MGGLADGVVVHGQVVADGAHHDLARIEPNPDQHLDAVAAAHLLGAAADGVLHGERGVAGAHRVVLVGERRAEQGHDAVAQHLVDHAFVAVHRLHHGADRRIEQLMDALGVATSDQLERTLDVGEQHGDLLALALDRAPGGADALGQVLGGVGLGRGEFRPAGRLGASELDPATAAEPCIRAVGMAAGRTAFVEGGAATLAEPVIVRVLELAPRTLQSRPTPPKALFVLMRVQQILSSG